MDDLSGLVFTLKPPAANSTNAASASNSSSQPSSPFQQQQQSMQQQQQQQQKTLNKMGAGGGGDLFGTGNAMFGGNVAQTTPRYMAPMMPVSGQAPQLQPASNFTGVAATKKKEDAFESLNMFKSSAAQPDLSKLSLAEQQRLKQQQQQQQAASTAPVNMMMQSNNSSPSAFGSVGMNTAAQPKLSSNQPPLMKPTSTASTPIAGNIMSQPSRSNMSSPAYTSGAHDAFSDLLSGFGSSKSQPVSQQTSPIGKAQTSTPMGQMNAMSKPTHNAAPVQLDAWNFDLLASSSKAQEPAAQNWGLKSAATVPANQSTSANQPAVDDDPFGLFSDKPRVSSPAPAPAVSKPAEPVPAPKTTTAQPIVEAPAPKVIPKEPQESITKPVASTAQPKAADLDEMVAKLVDIGFNAEESRNALVQNNLDQSKAIEYLINRPLGQKSSSQSQKTDIANKLTKLTGMSTKNAEKAEKLLNNASAFGMNLLNRAKNIVQESGKKIGKQTNSGSGNIGRADYGGFQDDSDERYQSFGVKGSASGWSSKESSNEDIKGGFENTFTQPSHVSRQNTASLAPSPPVKEVPKVTKKQRTISLVQCSQEQLSASERFKEEGNEFFKKGQYGDAEALYTKAIDALPTGHLQLIPMLNNRAAARLKNGAHRECQSDCTIVEQMCIQEMDYADVTPTQVQEYRDALSKALLRRATALESLEKYQEALQDFRKSIEYNPGAKGAQDGIRRCQKALAKPASTADLPKPPSTQTAPSQTFSSPLDDLAALAMPPQPKPAPSVNSSAFPHSFAAFGTNSVPKPSTDTSFKSERVEALRQQDREKEREEVEKFTLKDDVDAKLMAWKKGKETNIRALLSSLDTILWDEFKGDWKPVNLSELITPSQVKIRYMKAIGKLHPDKLSCMALTTEQKLLVNGIFSSLNDAWDAFKVQNNLS